MSRAESRHQVSRAKVRAVRVMETQQAMTRLPLPVDERRVGIMATTPKLCSCFMCGNRRKLEGAKVSELRRASKGESED